MNDIKNIKQEQKIIKKLENLTSINMDKEFIKLLSSYKNSLTLQIIEKFFNLIKPYSTDINTIKSSQLEFFQLKKILEDLQKTYIN